MTSRSPSRPAPRGGRAFASFQFTVSYPGGLLGTCEVRSHDTNLGNSATIWNIYWTVKFGKEKTIRNTTG